MKNIKISICFLMLIAISGITNNVEAQTLRELERVLSKKKVTPPPPPHRCTFWEDSWDDWETDGFLGINYSYSKQFPLSFSFQAHRSLLFIGFGLGFATNPSTYDYNSSTPDSSLSYTTIINGDTTRHYSYYNRDSIYSITPKGSWILIEPGLNFNFITLSCGFGFWWGEGEKTITSNNYGLYSNATSSGWIINPNMILHLPIPGTKNDVHFTINAGYNFLLPSIGEDDAVVKRLTAKGNGWRLGFGLEFKID